MKITKLVKELDKLKKDFGDIDVVVDIKDIALNNHGEYSHEDDFILTPEKIPFMDMDTMKLSKKKTQVISIQVE